MIALVYHQLPRIIGRSLYSVTWATRQFWMQVTGLVTVVLAMSIAGLIQGHLQIAGLKTGQPVSTGAKWYVITDAIRPLFILRMVGGALVAFGLFVFVAHLLRTVTMGEDAAVEELPFADETPEPAVVGMSA